MWTHELRTAFAGATWAAPGRLAEMWDDEDGCAVMRG
jgi:hypothetical protein